MVLCKINKMIINNVVDGGPALKVSAHLSFGQHVIDSLRAYSNEAGDDIAMIDVDTGEKITFKQILQGVVDIAVGLKKLGLKRGDVVALCGENKSVYIMAALATICCGATITTVNLMYSEGEIAHALKISRPKFMIASKNALESHISILKKTPRLKTIIQLNEAAIEKDILELDKVAVMGSDVKNYVPADVEGLSDAAFILYSSGTTGLPKGVMLTHLNLLYSLALFEDSKDRENAAVLSIVPWYHAYGLMTTINDLVVKNKIVYFSEGFNPLKYLECIKEYQIASLLAVPPIVVFLAKSPIVEEFDLSSVETVWCGAAPLSSETINGALKKLPNCIGVFQAYGMTETSLVATKDDPDLPKKPGCAGYPIRGLKVKVVNIDTREKLGPNQEGEICIKGPTIMKGYVGNETATREMFDKEGYLKTGDIGYYDADGCFFIVDRLKELIKYKGYQVAPAAVESVVLQHAGVAECGVVGRADEKAGELPTAFVVLKDGVKLTEKEIEQFANSKLSSNSQIRGGVILVDEIPKNPSGKILRRVLRQKLGKNKKKSKL